MDPSNERERFLDDDKKDSQATKEDKGATNNIISDCSEVNNDIKTATNDVETHSTDPQETIRFSATATQTPLTLKGIRLVKTSIENEDLASSTTSSFVESSERTRLSRSLNNFLDLDEKSICETMSIKFSHEATQATPPYPSQSSSKSPPSSRDVLRAPASVSSGPSGSKSEIETANYQSSDICSTLMDVEDRTDLPTFSKPDTNIRSLQYIAEEDQGFPSILPSPSRSSIVHFYSRRTRRRWNLKSCLKCIPTAEEEELDVGPYIREAPPTYSSIYASTPLRNYRRLFSLSPTRRSSFIAPIPPPSYAQSQGIRVSTYSMGPSLPMSPSTGSMWTSRPTAVICPRCMVIIMTAVEFRRSTITHLSALTLFLCGCWPCCVIPYCTNTCKITDHYCPLCHTYLGTYTPW